MVFREARTSDIQQLQLVRQSVKENVLHDPLSVTEYDYLRFLTIDGKGWVCEVGNLIVGFAIIDTKHHKVWALFVKPDFEVVHIGKTLHKTMLSWYFARYLTPICICMEPNSKGEKFYTEQGWKLSGTTKMGELKFEMEYNEWKALQQIDK